MSEPPNGGQKLPNRGKQMNNPKNLQQQQQQMPQLPLPHLPSIYSPTNSVTDFDAAYNMMTLDQPGAVHDRYPLNEYMHPQSPSTMVGTIDDHQRPVNAHTPPIMPLSPAGSPISPNTRNLLNTFNNINYSLASKNAMNQWKDTTKPVRKKVNVASNINQPELLSMTESSALESFLDSIASDVSFDKLAKQWSTIDPGNPAKEPVKRKAPKPSPVVTKKRKMNNDGLNKFDSSKMLLTEEEKKQNHTISEQKRRGMIKDSFKKLSALLDESKFEATLVDKRKNRSARKAMSKYNVLNRAIVEIEHLQAMNDKLRKLC